MRQLACIQLLQMPCYLLIGSPQEALHGHEYLDSFARCDEQKFQSHIMQFKELRGVFYQCIPLQAREKAFSLS